MLLFILDKSLLLVREELPNKENDKRLEQILNGEINADVLVIGSSRSSTGIIAGTIGDSLGLKGYNLSYLGSNIEFHEFILNTYLKSHIKKPKIIILGIDEISELIDRETIKFRYDILYPLVKYNLVREELYKREVKNEIVGNLFVRHQINHNFTNWNDANIYSKAPTLICGTSPLVGFEPGFDKSIFDKEEVYDSSLELSIKTKTLQRFIAVCNEQKIKLILAVLPNYWIPSKSFQNRLKIIVDHKCLIMNYDTLNKQYLNPENFYNSAHLNQSGAKIYTNEVLNYIKKELK